MRRTIPIVGLCLGILLAIVALSFSTGVAMAKNGTTHMGPFRSSSQDSGTCGNFWANDTYKRDFFVTDNGDGTFTLRENFTTGHFVTVAGQSPGACQAATPHGATVNAGIKGNFRGYEVGTVTGATFFNPKAKCTGACDSTDAYVQTFFGPNAKYSCTSGPGTCSFKFQYNALGHQGLILKHWQNASDDLGGNKGDIANN